MKQNSSLKVLPHWTKIVPIDILLGQILSNVVRTLGMNFFHSNRTSIGTKYIIRPNRRPTETNLFRPNRFSFYLKL